jgi:hypothetical protein
LVSDVPILKIENPKPGEFSILEIAFIDLFAFFGQDPFAVWLVV